jgi:tRNA/rRNA methyltransferase
LFHNLFLLAAQRVIGPAMSFEIILVNPEESLNIGSVARAMKNLGYSKLRLVSPRDYRPDRASITACHAVDLLESATIFPSLLEAIQDLHYVVGFSARDGDNRPVPLRLPDWVSQHLTRKASARTGLVFGPESSGLHLSDAALCQRMVCIPSSPDYSSFNLSHAVLLVLYEIERSGGGAIGTGALREADPARQSEIKQLQILVDEVAAISQFYRAGTPPIMRELLPHLLARMEPQQRDVQILLGLFSRIKKALVKTASGEDLFSTEE